MTALMATLLLFPFAGAALCRLLRIRIPLGYAGRWSIYYLAGVSGIGCVLYLLALMHVPLTRWTVVFLFLGTLAAMGRSGQSVEEPSTRPSMLATTFLIAPVLALLVTTSILPFRDYDGRVTWLPKVRAIAHDGSIDGPFFQGRAGLNLHNRYPLLLPLDGAAVLLATGSADVEDLRWMYALIGAATLFALRELLSLGSPACGPWIAASLAWLPAFIALDGGALSAYADVPLMGFAGIVMFALHRPELEDSGIRLAAVFLPALILSKNEGAVIAAILIASLALRRDGHILRPWLIASISAVLAIGILTLWRARVPPAYDECYALLFRALPDSLPRFSEAVAALVVHALDFRQWALFWPAVLTGCVLAALRRRAELAAPLLIVTAMFFAYALTFTVTSWDIQELAKASANRLLLHLTIPAAAAMAIGFEPTVTSSQRSRRFTSLQA